MCTVVFSVGMLGHFTAVGSHSGFLFTCCNRQGQVQAQAQEQEKKQEQRLEQGQGKQQNMFQEQE